MNGKALCLICSERITVLKECNNPMIVPLHCRQVIVLLTCLLRKRKLLPIGNLGSRGNDPHTATDLSTKETVFNAVSLYISYSDMMS